MKNRKFYFSQLIISMTLILIISGSCGGKKGADKLKPGTDEQKQNSTIPPGTDLYEKSLIGDIATIRQAIEDGLNVNEPDSAGRTFLMYSSFNGNTELMKVLIAKGAGVNAQDKYGRTALMMASSGPYPAAVKLLIQNYADPNLIDRDEHFTALMYAASEGQAEVIRILLGAGADPSKKDVDGDSAYTFAVNNGHSEAAALIKAALK